MVLSTLNDSKSAFCMATLFSGFFDTYTVPISPQRDMRCKLLTKLVLGIFKPHHDLTALQHVQLYLDPPSTRAAHTLHIDYQYKHAVRQAYNLYFEECDPLFTIMNKDACSGQFKASPKVLAKYLMNFMHDLSDVTIRCELDGMTMSSFSAVEDGHELVTRCKILAVEFDVYQGSNEAHELTFGFKEWRAIVQLAEHTGASVAVYFGQAGEPVFVTVHATEGMVVDFVLSTRFAETMETVQKRPSSLVPDEMPVDKRRRTMEEEEVLTRPAFIAEARRRFTLQQPPPQEDEELSSSGSETERSYVLFPSNMF